MTDPIPFMTRRARLIRGETQDEFAEHMGVDQATISRWERSRGHPTPAKLAEIHKIITRAEPSYNPEYILASPTIKYVCKLDDFSKPLLLSKGLLEELGVTLNANAILETASHQNVWESHGSLLMRGPGRNRCSRPQESKRQ